MDYLEKKLNIQKMEDWYHVGKTDFYQNHGSGLLNWFGVSSFAAILSRFPTHDWEFDKFRSLPKLSTLKWSFDMCLESIFPNISRRLGFIQVPLDWLHPSVIQYFLRHNGMYLRVYAETPLSPLLLRFGAVDDTVVKECEMLKIILQADLRVKERMVNTQVWLQSTLAMLFPSEALVTKEFKPAIRGMMML